MLSTFVVSVPVTEVSLLSISDLRLAAGVTDGRRDSELLLLGRRASTAIARRCNVRDDGANPPTLLRETCVETFRWSGCGPLSLSRRPVASVASVTLGGTAVDGGIYEAIGRDLHYLSSGDLADWPAGRIVVTYDAGYSTAPYDLALAATKLVTALSTEQARDPSLKRESIPGVIDREYWVAPSDDPLLSQEIADLLSPYIERHV